MCYEFEKTGKCEYGDECAYSHDASALQERYGKDDGTDGKRLVKRVKITSDSKNRQQEEN